MRNKTLRDRSINTSRIEWFPFLLPLSTLLSIIQFEVRSCAFLCNHPSRLNVLMNESWSHVGSQPHTSRFYISRFLASLGIKVQWIAHWGSVDFLGWIQAWALKVSGEFAIFISLGDQILLLRLVGFCYVVVFFGGSDYFPINCKVSKSIIARAAKHPSSENHEEKSNERQRPEICARVPLSEVSRCSILCPYREWLLGWH